MTVTIRGVVNLPCFICNAKEKCVDVQFADRTFRGVLCLDHVYAKLKQEPKEVKDAPSLRTA